MNTQRLICVALHAALFAGTLSLGGYSGLAQAQASGAEAPPYTPPSADQLYQLVAPIALYPDNLVAQVLAASTYPDQIGAAQNLLLHNPNLKGTLLQAAIDPQPWDASVKGLTAFPEVLRQMASNPQWTAALGTVYVNDPTDVMNSIQVMRQRAAQHGNLQSSQQQRVVVQPTDSQTYLDESAGAPPPVETTVVYEGPEVVPAPAETIVIEPANPETVYVPYYNPAVVYGGPVSFYPGYTYAPAYSGADIAMIGAVGFGVGILVGDLFGHNHYYHGPAWGWHSWGMRWGGGPRGPGGPRAGWGRPAVVYNHNTYVSHSTTIINHYGNRGGGFNNGFGHGGGAGGVPSQWHGGGPGGAPSQWHGGAPGGAPSQWHGGGPAGAPSQWHGGGPGGAPSQWHGGGPGGAPGGAPSQWHGGGPGGAPGGAPSQWHGGGSNGAPPQAPAGGPGGASPQFNAMNTQINRGAPGQPAHTFGQPVAHAQRMNRAPQQGTMQQPMRQARAMPQAAPRSEPHYQQQFHPQQAHREAPRAAPAHHGEGGHDHHGDHR